MSITLNIYDPSKLPLQPLKLSERQFTERPTRITSSQICQDTDIGHKDTSFQFAGNDNK